MPKLPVVSGKQCCKALGKLGFVEARQKGSHVVPPEANSYQKLRNAGKGRQTLLAEQTAVCAGLGLAKLLGGSMDFGADQAGFFRPPDFFLVYGRQMVTHLFSGFAVVQKNCEQLTNSTSFRVELRNSFDLF